MDEFRCMVSYLDRGIISDIINRILKDDKFIIRESVDDMKSLKCHMESGVSCVIFDKKDKQLPVEYKSLFNINNQLTVIELLNNGRSVAVFVDDVGERDFSNIVKIKE